MKKISIIVLTLILVFSLVACRGGFGGNSGASGSSADVTNSSTDKDPCQCCPDCVQKECVCAECGDNDKYDCECAAPGVGEGPFIFSVEIDTNLTGSLGQVYRTIGTATVSLDDYDDSGWFGSANGYGVYSDWGDEIYAETENATDYNFYVRLANYDPLKSDSITVGTDRFCSNAGNGYVMLSFEMLRTNLIDEETELYTFEIPMENGVAILVDHWNEPLPGLIIIDTTITIARIDK